MSHVPSVILNCLSLEKTNFHVARTYKVIISTQDTGENHSFKNAKGLAKIRYLCPSKFISYGTHLILGSQNFDSV
jgi:hypothetical protein